MFGLICQTIRKPIEVKSQPRPQGPTLSFFQNGRRFKQNPGKCWSQSWVSGVGSLNIRVKMGQKELDLIKMVMMADEGLKCTGFCAKYPIIFFTMNWGLLEREDHVIQIKNGKY